MTGKTTAWKDAAATVVTVSSSNTGSDPDSGGKEDRKREKKERKREERREKRREEKSGKINNGVGGSDEVLMLAKNKVSSGNYHKMRDAKDLTKKSAADMVAIFGVGADVYYPSDVVDPKSNPSTLLNGGLDGGPRDRDKRSRYMKGGDDDGRLSGKRKKKTKRLSKKGGERFTPSRRAAEKRDNEYDGSRDVIGKAQAYWAGKLKWFTQQNNNGGTAASMAQSPSHAKKRPTKKRPTQIIRCGIAEVSR